ncbi:MAG: hypothetical protein Q7U78_13760 [Gallionella sp.]|nr:hypothetical protein [Gallionella sp.]
MKSISKQRGIALLVFVAVLVTTAAAVTVTALNRSSQNVHIARDKITAAALAQAKEALIGYAITYGDIHSGEVHGYLPCPDTSGTDIGGEGGAAGSCGAKDVSVIGRLPWKKLNSPPLRGGDNECLWYAVSGTYKNNPPTGLMNWDTNGQLQVYAHDGVNLLTPADNQAVAVIIAPGVALDSSHPTVSGTSSCSGNYLASNYLDNDTVHHINNADIAAGKFIQPHKDRDANGNIILTVNDQIAYITKQDIWNAMKRRELVLLAKLDNMTELTARCIAEFGKKNKIDGFLDRANQSLPWPTRLTLSDYGATASYYDKKNLFSGRVPYQVDISRAKTGNIISSDYLLTKGTYNEVSGHWENNCPNPDDWATIYPWWFNWKEHLFYAVSERFQPSSSATNPVCDSDHQCLHVNHPSNASNYAAVVIFAGKNLSGSARSKSDISKYLEGRNTTNMTGSANGNENYQADTTSGTFNDIVYCIKDDANLTVVSGSAAGCP